MESGWFSVLRVVALVVFGAWTLQGCTKGVGQIDVPTTWAAQVGRASLPADGAGGSPVASPPVRGWGAIDVAAMGGTGRDSAVAALDDRAAVAATFTDLLEGRATVAFAPLCRCPGRARPADV